MSTEIFPFTVHRPYHGEGGAHLTQRSSAEGGREFRRAALPANGLFRVRRAVLRFPPNDPTTFQSWFDDRQGGYDSWLFLPALEVWRVVTDEALGTSTGGAGETFALDSKHIKASTLVVKVGGVDQDGDWNLTGNYSAPIVNTEAGFDAGAVTATYDRYIPVRFDQDDFDFDVSHFGADDDSSTLYVRTLTWRQDRPGSHLV